MIQTERVNELICKYKISPTQVYILWLLHTDDITNMKKYVEVFGEFDNKDFIDLENKGLIYNTNPTGRFASGNIVVTLEFAEELATIDPDDAYEEFFDNYPDYLVVNTKKVPAKTLTFPDEKAAKEAYRNIVKKSKFIHQRILKAVVKYKEINDGYAIVKIDKFITGRLWEAIEKQEDDKPVKTRNY